jgi:diguanylate cyclase (GGDEF)-like protein/PAS domain S-box-containing protein
MSESMPVDGGTGNVAVVSVPFDAGAYDFLEDPVLVHTPEGCVVHANAAAREMFHASQQELLGTSCHDWLPAGLEGRPPWIAGSPDEADGWRFESAVVHRGTGLMRLDVRSRRVDAGGDRFVVTVARPLPKGPALEDDCQLKSLLLDRASDWVAVVDSETKELLYINEVAADRLGHARSGLTQAPCTTFFEAPKRYRKSVQDRLAKDGDVRFETDATDRDGESVRLEVHAQTITYAGREVVVSYSRDISERMQAEATIERLAYYDPLTGLANRRLFDDRLQMAIAQSKRSGRAIMLVFVDLDRLKGVNDSLGHDVGDRILKKVAKRLTSIVREGDTVARLGGDEFVMLLLDMGEADGVEIGERITSVLEAPVLLKPKNVEVSASVGIAVCPAGSVSAETLLQQADVAMYSVKQAGGGGYKMHDERMTTATVERFTLQSELRHAFEHGELDIFYQPMVRLDDNAVVGAEALLRWTHPERGDISPTVFVPIAEQCGMIIPIGGWVLETACRQARAWQDQGRTGFRVGVNVSVRQFTNCDLGALVARCLEDTGLDADCLELEVTEGIALNDSEEVRQTLSQLRDLGVRIAIDDFGVGYSSLSSIERYPVHTLKVDRSFVWSMNEAADSQGIVRTVIELGRQLDLNVVAEGVETQSQLDLLKDLHCTEMQGFLCSPAVPAAEFPAVVGWEQ